MQHVGRIVVWGCLLTSVALAAAQQAEHGKLVQVGQRYFVQYCSACHGIEGRGDGPVAASLQTPPADLTRIAQRRGGHFPVTEITAYIDGRRNASAPGYREMPAWGERFGELVGRDELGEAVVESHLRLLIAYLQSIQQ